MAKYELSDSLVQALRAIVGSASIKGADAPIVVQLMQALRAPAREEKVEEKK